MFVPNKDKGEGSTALDCAQAAERLRETHRLLSIAEGLGNLGHWRLEPESDLIERSAEASALMGLDPTMAVSAAKIVSRIALGDRFGLLRNMVRALRGETEVECRIRLNDGKGAQRYLLIRAQALSRSDGTRKALFGVIRDISEEIATKAKLIAARDEAQAATSAKGEFLATMSHEIRTPMTGVLGMIDLIGTATDADERAQYLAAMRHSAQMLMGVLDSILDFSKIEAGRIEIATKCFNLVELARQTVLLFGNAGSAKGIALEFSAEPGVSPVVRGDPLRVQQVMSNFVSNAIKFTDQGRVAVSVRARAARKGYQRWRIAVRDTGEGICQTKLQRLFDPFVQLGDPLAGGTGLGLAISRRLVEAMGGKTHVRSTPGRGSTFSFEIDLPIEQVGETASPRPAEPTLIPAARPLDVLVAEDNPINQMLVTAMVRRLGHRVTAVGNGRRAAECALAVPYDCILMDMQMPEMDGVQATRLIRDSGGSNTIVPIFALTADAAPERRRFYENIGLTDFMTKPIDSARLQQILSAIAATPRARRLAAPLAVAIDMAQIEEIQLTLGEEKLIQLLEMAQLEVVDRPATIRAVAEGQDFGRLRAEAHALTGSMASLGLVAVGLAAKAVELAAPGPELELALDRLDGESMRARLALAPLLNGQAKAVAVNG